MIRAFSVGMASTKTLITLGLATLGIALATAHPAASANAPKTEPSLAVEVVNTAWTRDAERSSRQRFTKVVDTDISFGFSMQTHFLTVPWGKVAVIELIACKQFTKPGLTAAVSVLVPGSPETGEVGFPLTRTKTDDFGRDVLVGSHATKLYLFAGAYHTARDHVLRVEVSENPGYPYAGTCTVSGYFAAATDPENAELSPPIP